LATRYLLSRLLEGSPGNPQWKLCEHPERTINDADEIVCLVCKTTLYVIDG
jgi:hypothetical protein